MSSNGKSWHSRSDSGDHAQSQCNASFTNAHVQSSFAAAPLHMYSALRSQRSSSSMNCAVSAWHAPVSPRKAPVCDSPDADRRLAVATAASSYKKAAYQSQVDEALCAHIPSPPSSTHTVMAKPPTPRGQQQRHAHSTYLDSNSSKGLWSRQLLQHSLPLAEPMQPSGWSERNASLTDCAVRPRVDASHTSNGTGRTCNVQEKKAAGHDDNKMKKNMTPRHSRRIEYSCILPMSRLEVVGSRRMSRSGSRTSIDAAEQQQQQQQPMQQQRMVGPTLPGCAPHSPKDGHSSVILPSDPYHDYPVEQDAAATTRSSGRKEGDHRGWREYTRSANVTGNVTMRRRSSSSSRECGRALPVVMSPSGNVQERWHEKKVSNRCYYARARESAAANTSAEQQQQQRRQETQQYQPKYLGQSAPLRMAESSSCEGTHESASSKTSEPLLRLGSSLPAVVTPLPLAQLLHRRVGQEHTSQQQHNQHHSSSHSNSHRLICHHHHSHRTGGSSRRGENMELSRAYGSLPILSPIRSSSSLNETSCAHIPSPPSSTHTVMAKPPTPRGQQQRHAHSTYLDSNSSKGLWSRQLLQHSLPLAEPMQPSGWSERNASLTDCAVRPRVDASHTSNGTGRTCNVQEKKAAGHDDNNDQDESSSTDSTASIHCRVYYSPRVNSLENASNRNSNSNKNSNDHDGNGRRSLVSCHSASKSSTFHFKRECKTVKVLSKSADISSLSARRRVHFGTHSDPTASSPVTAQSARNTEIPLRSAMKSAWRSITAVPVLPKDGVTNECIRYRYYSSVHAPMNEPAQYSYVMRSSRHANSNSSCASLHVTSTTSNDSNVSLHV